MFGDNPTFLKSSNEAALKFSMGALKVPISWHGSTPGMPVPTSNFFLEISTAPSGIKYTWQDRVALCIASITLPTIDLQTEKKNQYNRTRVIHKSKKYGQLSMTFHDTSDRAVRLMIDDYITHYYGDFRLNPNSWLLNDDFSTFVNNISNDEYGRWKRRSANITADPINGFNLTNERPSYGYNPTTSVSGQTADILSSHSFFRSFTITSFIGGARTEYAILNPKIANITLPEHNYEDDKGMAITITFEIEHMYFSMISNDTVRSIDASERFMINNTKVYEPSPDASPVSIFNTTLPFGGGNLSSKIISKLPVLRNEKIINAGKKLNQLGALVNPKYQNGVLGTFGGFDFGEMIQGTKTAVDWVDPEAIAKNGATVANALTGISGTAADIATSVAKSMSNSGILKGLDVASQAISDTVGIPLQGAKNLLSDVSTKFSVKTEPQTIDLGFFE